jgi:hypothetical protein
MRVQHSHSQKYSRKLVLVTTHLPHPGSVAACARAEQRSEGVRLVEDDAVGGWWGGGGGEGEVACLRVLEGGHGTLRFLGFDDVDVCWEEGG